MLRHDLKRFPGAASAQARLSRRPRPDAFDHQFRQGQCPVRDKNVKRSRSRSKVMIMTLAPGSHAAGETPAHFMPDRSSIIRPKVINLNRSLFANRLDLSPNTPGFRSQNTSGYKSIGISRPSGRSARTRLRLMSSLSEECLDMYASIVHT